MEAKLPKKVKKHLCIASLLKVTRRGFGKAKDTINQPSEISLVDCLMSGVALFGLKFASLLQFDKARMGHRQVCHNLRALYGVERAPCDTYFRERLDDVALQPLQKVLNRLVALVQRSKLLEGYRYVEDYYLVPIDGTGYFSSHEVHCKSCCEKHHRDGTVTYYHQLLSAVLAHPKIKTVLPLSLEPIIKSDGSRKNDCEHSAAKRLLNALRTSHPHLKIIVVLDALYADGRMIQLLKALNLRFIITAKSNDLKYLFEFYRTTKHQTLDQQQEGVQKHYEWANHLPLNANHPDLEVNIFDYQERDKKGNEKYFCWLTDLAIDEKTVDQLVKGGRARWRIENETFNTLKNQGYQFEHNFGHGHKNLSTVLAYLMFIAFLMDQIQEFACNYFKAILTKKGGRLYVWQPLRNFFFHFFIDTWEQLYDALLGRHRDLRLADLLDSC